MVFWTNSLRLNHNSIRKFIQLIYMLVINTKVNRIQIFVFFNFFIYFHRNCHYSVFVSLSVIIRYCIFKKPFCRILVCARKYSQKGLVYSTFKKILVSFVLLQKTWLHFVLPPKNMAPFWPPSQKHGSILASLQKT